MRKVKTGCCARLLRGSVGASPFDGGVRSPTLAAFRGHHPNQLTNQTWRAKLLLSRGPVISRHIEPAIRPLSSGNAQVPAATGALPRNVVQAAEADPLEIVALSAVGPPATRRPSFRPAERCRDGPRD